MGLMDSRHAYSYTGKTKAALIKDKRERKQRLAKRRKTQGNA